METKTITPRSARSKQLQTLEEQICASVDKEFLEKANQTCANAAAIAAERLKNLSVLKKIAAGRLKRTQLEKIIEDSLSKQVIKDARLKLIPKLGPDDRGTLLELSVSPAVSVSTAAKAHIKKLKL